MPYKVKNNCVYKKEDNKLVGCTKGDVNKYLGALYANAKESVNKLVGGKADSLSIEDIAKKFNKSVDFIKKQIELGVEVESEHTNDMERAREIAMDHLSEIPDYYDRLIPMEKKAEKEYLREHIKERLSYFKKNT